MSLWQRLISRLPLGRASDRPLAQSRPTLSEEHESITLPVLDSYDEETNRYIEIRYSVDHTKD